MEYTQELHDILAKNNLFKGLTETDFKELANILSHEKFKEKENIVIEGENPDKIYVILRGSGKVIKSILEDDVKVDHEIAVLKAGDSIGDVTLIDRQPRSATVRAAEPTETISFRIDDLSSLSRHEDSIEAKLKINFALRLSQYLRGSNTNTLTERKKHKSEITQLTNFDIVTGLPNHILFKEKLTFQLKDKPNTPVALIQIEICSYKDVCDVMGSDFGDQFLAAVSERLTSSLDRVALVGRLRFNQFIILSDDVPDDETIKSIASQIILLFKQPFVIQTDSVFTNVYLGISRSSTDGRDAENLLKYSGLAVDASKLGAPNTFAFYSKEMDELVAQRHQLIRELHDAMEKNQFQLYYQAQVDLETGKIIGVESLIRWIHPEKGVVSPVIFIPIVEQAGMIIELGHWIFRNACIQAKKWDDAGHPLRVAVNLSSIQFMQKDLLPEFEKVIKEVGIKPSLIELEITESVMLSDIEETIEKIQSFVDMGFIFAIDDFGTGYSSLSYLRRLPIHKIKVDQSFVRDISKSADAKDIIRCIVGMAKGLRLDTIAEGIEYEDQRDFLRELKVDEGQGYMFSKPITAQEIEEKYFR